MKMKSFFAGLLALVMSVSMMTVTAFAATNDTQLTVDETAKTITVSTPAQFKAISEYSNSSADTEAYPRTFANWTVIIANDLDMTGISWTPLKDFNGNMQGTLKEDGTTPVISHLTVTSSEKAGLCANSSNGLFSDLTISDSTFKTTDTTSGAYAGAFAANGFTSDFVNCNVQNTTVEGVRFVGGVVGYSYGNITDCDVTNCEVKTNADFWAQVAGRGDNIGGVVGLLCEGSMTVIDCDVTGTNITGLRQVAGIAGGVMYGNTIRNCNVSNCEIKATGSNRSGGATACAGGIVGQLASQAAGQPITITGNTVAADVTISGKVVGWAVGDASSRAVDGSTYTISNTYGNGTETPSIDEVGK